MCGRFTQHYMWEEIHDLYELTAAKPPTNMRPRKKVWKPKKPQFVRYWQSRKPV
jgi:hypothetical protein